MKMGFLFRTAFVFTALLMSLAADTQNITNIEEVTAEQYALKECAFDKEADAVVIFDKATSTYDEEYRLVTTRKVRIKILKENGIEKANIKIPFYSKNNFELMRNIGGFSVTPVEGSPPVWTHLEKKSIYTSQVNELYSEVSFALPNVQVGSIIEYWYESVVEHYGGLQDWYFQSDMPVMLSHYNLYVVPNAVFSYVVKKSPALNVDISRDESTGRVSFTMKNIPGLRGESYSPSHRNYLQRIDFQLSAVVTRYGSTIKYSNTWKNLNKDLLEDKNFGGAIKKSLAGSSEVEPYWINSSTPYDKMTSIYNYVRKNISWDHFVSKYASNNLKNILEKKKGNSGEINLLLVNLLKGADLDVFPMLVSERSHGKVDTSYSFLEQFNKIVACVELNGKHYILDGTDYYTPIDMIPVELLNTVGFIVDKKRYGFRLLQDKNKKRTISINMRSMVTSDLIEGTAVVSQYDYARVGNAQRYRSDKSGYLGQLIKSTQGIQVDSFTVRNLDADSTALIHEIDLKQALNKTGEYYLLNYGLFTGFDKNPFISENRFTNIDFGTPSICVLNAVYTLPESLTIESLPKNSRMIIPGEQLVAIREASISGKELKVSLRIEIKSAEFSVNDYLIVQEFFKKLAEMLNEPVVLRANVSG